MPKHQKVVKQYVAYSTFEDLLYSNKIKAGDLLRSMNKAPQSAYGWRDKGLVPHAVYVNAVKTLSELKIMLAKELESVDYSNQTARRKHSIMQSCVDKVVKELAEQNKKPEKN